MKLLEGKVAVVTGAARGIGEGIVLKFAEHGAHVAFTYVSDSSAEKAKSLEEKIKAQGVSAGHIKPTLAIMGSVKCW
jgi:3-oxoacyl-[acyl-carrier protein] reductase